MVMPARRIWDSADLTAITMVRVEGTLHCLTGTAHAVYAGGNLREGATGQGVAAVGFLPEPVQRRLPL